jgi:hypothetical protein
MACFIILAKKAFQVTTGHKYSSGSPASHKWGFFPKMREMAGNDWLVSHLTITHLLIQTVYPAVSGTNLTIFQEIC